MKRFPNLQPRLSNWRNHLRIIRLARQVAVHERSALPLLAQTTSPAGNNRESGDGLYQQPQPVVIFNPTARISGLSQNAAFAALAAWSLRLAGTPVAHFVCQGGMSRCVLGTNRDDFHQPPPCQTCIRQSRRLHSAARVNWFKYQPDVFLQAELQSLNVDELSRFEAAWESEKHNRPIPSAQPMFPSIPHPSGGSQGGVNTIPLGRLVLPSIRWALRKHTLPDDEETRYLLREYILSAYNVAREFSVFLDRYAPAAALIFNGTMFPEATARWVAQVRGLRVITYEVGFQRFSAFLTEGEATAYPIEIPADFELSAAQNARLDEYLEKRFKGQFTMAGVRFWPEMRGLDETFLAKAAQFEQIVPIFTNVVYDTSQVHANTVFPHMFAWLDQALEIIRAHPRTLFVIRAHPDEMRPGTRKVSRETVAEWVRLSGASDLPNVVFIGPQEYLSSYELIQRSKFVMVYNSSIGLEAALLGTPVLCAGKARYTRYPIVFFPETQAAHRAWAEQFLSDETVVAPPEFQRNARRFLYYQLFRASLSFEDFLEPADPGPTPVGAGLVPAQAHAATNRPPGKARRVPLGYVHLRQFPWQALLPENSPTLRVVVDGINRPPTAEAKPDLPITRTQFLIEDPFEQHRLAERNPERKPMSQSQLPGDISPAAQPPVGAHGVRPVSPPPASYQGDRIELLPVSLLDENRVVVEDLKALARSLRLEFGWHYLLDLAWISRGLAQHLGAFDGRRIMDAGAGTGIVQWYLASRGVEVISTDRMSRSALPLRFRRRFRVQGLRPADLLPAKQVFAGGLRGSSGIHAGGQQSSIVHRLVVQTREAAGYLHSPEGSGRVFIYNQDLARLADLVDNSLDAVVSVSALEHNTPEGLQMVVSEIMRVLRPGGALLATLTAGRDADWWHAASSGWCYSETSLRRLFDLSAEAPSNYDRYDEIFAGLRGCAELRDNLASFYFHSNEKGMPGGVWDPQYQPVGVCKIKAK